MESSKISIHASVSADKQKAWDYYTRPEHITKWNYASDDWFCPEASNDMRVGGKYVARMASKDGTIGFDFEAVYNDITGEGFLYTMPDGRQVNVHFEQVADNTNVTVTFDAEAINPIELQREGWQAILNHFKVYTENN
jgi:uncharacterized protein YndB with AHSA1/START domain